MGRFLGLDSSTQSLSAIVVDTDSGEVVLDLTVNYGQELPQYRSPQGFLPHADPLVKHSDPLMWVEALDLLLSRARESGFDWSTIDGISGAGQQHGSVYLNDQWAGADWVTGTPLHEQVRPLLSRATAPIWMDSSTAEECAEIGAAVGLERVTEITGSRPIERFTGPQIRKFAKDEPAAYAATARIHLVSSFMCSLLVGGDAPLDLGDGAGMNLLDLAPHSWSRVMADATADGLLARLPVITKSSTVAGSVHRYFVEAYGFAPGCRVAVWTGDNPSSLVGMGATAPGTAVISLGTSDTYFGAMNRPTADPRGYGHVFGNPAGGYMSLIAFKNGSLAREEVQREYGISWDDFAADILERSQPGNAGNVTLPYYVSEITPLILEPAVKHYGSPAFVDGSDRAARVRGIVEAQALSMKRHSDWISDQPTSILVTGGASRNPGVLQIVADVFQADLKRLSVANASGLGGALRAANTIGGHPLADLTATFAAPVPGSTVHPNPAAAPAYAALATSFASHLHDDFGV